MAKWNRVSATRSAVLFEGRKVSQHSEYRDRLLQVFADCGALWPEAGCDPIPGEDAAPFRILLIVAHPDDESECSVTLYRAAHEVGAVVDQVFVTDGEAGVRYAGPARPYYRNAAKRLTGKSLGAIRRAEVLRASRILGISRNFFLSQPDTGFTLDVEEALSAWNLPCVRKQLFELIASRAYDVAITLLPTPDTHGHHKTVALLAAETIAGISPEKRPALLGVRTAGCENESGEWSAHQLTVPATSASPIWCFDRRTPFPEHPELDYRIVANWVVAEHKSQGMFQMELGRATHECFWLLEAGGEAGCHRWERFRQQLDRPGVLQER
jgi:LmbE family N-acetylglucosaminyl deacetylase